MNQMTAFTFPTFFSRINFEKIELMQKDIGFEAPGSFVSEFGATGKI